MSIRVGGERYAVPVENVREIADFGLVAALPGAGPAVLGVRNLRGQVLPVFDLAAVLGVERADGPLRILVAEDGGRRAGLAVDDVTDVGEESDGATRLAAADLFAALARTA
ncbi:MAG: chemotaxis protein CheW [Actinobacteria bacterium]|nr:chemotaxis protein CheW [Actinomycetota bacterium]